jgi:hypothetical protein
MREKETSDHGQGEEEAAGTRWKDNCVMIERTNLGIKFCDKKKKMDGGKEMRNVCK